MQETAETQPARVVLVEDDPDQQNIYSAWLRNEGYRVEVCADAASLLAMPVGEMDLLVLDWELPDLDGLNLLRTLRARGEGIPVLFLTARKSADDIVDALRSGADDFVSKPCEQEVLRARCGALLRRSTAEAQPTADLTPYTIDVANERISLDGRPLSLTNKEFHLARYLFQNLGRIVSRDELFVGVWGKPAVLNTRTVDVHISRLRKKLELPEGWALRSVYHHGYRLDHLTARETDHGEEENDD